MAYVRTKISVKGFSSADIAACLQDLQAELRERSWLINPQLAWDEAQSLLLITVETEGVDPSLESESIFDDVWDSVIACCDFGSARIKFDILEAKLVEPS
jgi:hypothetical protein